MKIFFRIIIIGIIIVQCNFKVSFGQSSDNCALLIIDPQNAIFPIRNQSTFVQNVNTLISKAETGGVLKVYFQFNDNDGFRNGTYGWEISAYINISQNDIVIQKYYQNSFTATNLHSLLSSHNISTIYITGLQSQYCVKQTCLGGLSLGYNVVLVEDAHSNNHSVSVINSVNNEMANAGCSLIQTAEVNWGQTSIVEHSSGNLNFSIVPNPFRISTTIQYELPSGTEVILKIYDSSGIEIKTLEDKFQNQGIHTVFWNGKNNNGGKCIPGVYYCRIFTQKYSYTKKFVLAK